MIEMDDVPIDGAALLAAMVDAYLARRRKGAAFDEIAAIQAYWEYEPRFAEGQAQAFMDRGRRGSMDGWKLVLRCELAKRQGVSRP